MKVVSVRAPEQLVLDLRVRRHELGVTQADVAEAVDMSRAAVSHVEIGRSRPTLEMALRYAHLLGGDLVFVERSAGTRR